MLNAFKYFLYFVQAALLAIFALFLLDFLLAGFRWQELLMHLYEAAWGLGLIWLLFALVKRGDATFSWRSYLVSVPCLAATKPVTSAAMLRLDLGRTSASVLLALLLLMGWGAHRAANRIQKRQAQLGLAPSTQSN